MSSHTISHASELSFGSAYMAGANGGKRGVPLTPILQINLGAPEAADAAVIAASQTPGAAGDLTLASTELDVPRTVSITSAADDSGATFTVYGTDEYGHALSEDVTGPNAAAVETAKAFKAVTRIAISAAAAGAITAGSGTTLGLPYRIGGAFDVLQAFRGNTAKKPTLAGGDGSVATATTGDVRGTMTPTTAPDGSAVYRLWIKVHDVSSREGTYGVEQA